MRFSSMTQDGMQWLIGAAGLSLLLSLAACETPSNEDGTGSISSAPQTAAPPQGEVEVAPQSTLEESPFTLSFVDAEEKGLERTVTLAYQRAVGETRARAVELYLKLGGGLLYQRAEMGEVLQRGGKELIVQEPEQSLLRVIVFSRGNLDPLGDGPLFRLRLSAVAGGAETIEILSERPLFAPSEANHSLHLPTRFTFAGGQ